LDQAELAAQARALPVAVSEDFLIGMGDVMQRLQSLARRAAQRE